MRREETARAPAGDGSRSAGLPVRIGISACLLGDEVRYDGGHKRDAFLTEVLAPHVEWVPVCPEVEIGLGTPRPPIRLEARAGEIRLVMPETGEDLTERMRAYAERRVGELKEEALCGYVLKARSPSCGLGSVEVRDGSGGRRRGNGAFARVLGAGHPLLPIAEETDLAEPRRRERFVTGIWARHRWLRCGLPASPGRPDETSAGADGTRREEALAAFHARHRGLLLARDPAATRRLDRLAARAGPGESREGGPGGPVAAYARGFARTLRRVPGREGHERALRDLARRLSDRLPSAAREELVAAIDRFAAGELTLDAPVSLLRALARDHGPRSMREEAYLRPYPEALGQRPGI